MERRPWPGISNGQGHVARGLNPLPGDRNNDVPRMHAGTGSRAALHYFGYQRSPGILTESEPLRQTRRDLLQGDPEPTAADLA